MTQEELELFYERCKEYSKAKHGIIPDYIRLDYDGLYAIEHYPGCCGDPDEISSYYINVEELNSDLDSLIAIRLEEERLAKIKKDKEREDEKIRHEKLQLDREKEQYLKLKKKFE